jgi:hypothetical protein
LREYVVRRNASAGAAAIPVPVARSLANAARRVYWLDQPDAPEPLPALAGKITADGRLGGVGPQRGLLLGQPHARASQRARTVLCRDAAA